MSDVREAFEKQAERLGYVAAREGDGYLYEEVQVGWDIWQAAHAQGDAEPVVWIEEDELESLQEGFTIAYVRREEDRSGLIPLYTRPPNAGVPEWMIEVSGNLATQDNRITQDPLFVVFQKREIVAHEDYDHDRISWGNCEGEADDEVQDWLNDAREDADGDHYLDDEIELHDEDSGTETFRRVALKEIDEFVTACFTEAGAKDYIKANGHNLTRPHIYVTSLYRNEEMKRFRDWLMPQPPKQEGDQ